MSVFLNRTNSFMAPLALVLAVLAVLFAVSLRSTPCAQAASGSCSVGDNENFSDNVTFDSGTSFTYTLDHAITADRTLVLPDAAIAKGAIYAGTAANTFGVLTVGTNDEVLIADSGETTGVKWGTFVPATTFLDKTSDQTVNNSSTLQDDDDLTFSVAANKNYAIQVVLMVTGGTTPDFKFQWSLPAAATFDGQFLSIDGGGSWSPITEATSNLLNTVGTDQTFMIEGILKVEGTAGTAVMQWAQNVANASDTKVLEGSWLAWRLLN